MTEPRMDGEHWLSAAVSGGWPEPSLSRWQPLRVGIVNLWEYDNAEFWFADGRLAAVRAETERPPPAPVLWRRRERPDRDCALGAPLWQCVQPVDGLPPEQLDLLEATLAASGLLDAWLTPAGGLSTVDGVEPFDIQLRIPNHNGVADTVATVLEPTSAGGVPNPVIHRVLVGIGWHASRPAAEQPTAEQPTAWLATDGTWRVGALTGRAEAVQPASYLGATAREAARQREITRLEIRLAELEALIETLDLTIGRITENLFTLDAEARRVPPERPVTDAVMTWRERQTRLLRCRQRLESAQAAHQQKESAKDAAWAVCGEYAGRYAFPLQGLDELATALHIYRGALSSLESALELVRARHAALATAEQILATQHGCWVVPRWRCTTWRSRCARPRSGFARPRRRWGQTTSGSCAAGTSSTKRSPHSAERSGILTTRSAMPRSRRPRPRTPWQRTSSAGRLPNSRATPP
ncbi:MAG: hypothetical protein ACRDTA_11685 [Pseudonocardiaceae bacterium]